MHLYLLAIFTHQGNISEVLVFFEAFKCAESILFEIVPLQTQFFRHDMSGNLTDEKWNGIMKVFNYLTAKDIYRRFRFFL